MSATAPPTRDRPLLGLSLMLAASGSFTLMNAMTAALGRQQIPWEMSSFARASIGLVVAASIARGRGVSLAIDNRRVMWTRSLAGSTSMLLTFFSLTHMPLADATALLNTTPLWISLLAWAMLSKRPGRAVFSALALAMAGVWFVVQPTFARGQWVGVVALTAGAASALSMVSLRRLGKETPEAVVVHFSAVASMVTFVALLLRVLRDGAIARPAGVSWVLLAGVGVSATAGQLLMTRAYSLDRAARIGAAGWAQVVFALLLDGLVRARWPERSAATGIALLLGAGVVLVESARREQRIIAAAARAVREEPT